MTDKIHIPAKHEMVVDQQAMTITVGSRVFDKPDLLRRPEWDFDLKGQICGYPSSVNRDVKLWHKFYAGMLGCRFNFRFFAANYWLWIGERMETRTANMLRYEGRHWRLYNSALVHQAHKVLPYVNEAERDGLYNLIPIIVAFGASPQAIRSEIGRGAWRRVANNSVSRNVLFMNAIDRSNRLNRLSRAQSLLYLLDIPSGVLRWVHYFSEDEAIAAHIAPRKRREEFEQTRHLIIDTRRMLGRNFNPRWSLARMREEHDNAAREALARRYPRTQFADDWSFEDNGYTATLLTSQADIALEGQTQSHCVASYAQSAAAGQYAVFKIDGKERATLGVQNGLVNQVYGACNNAVSDECRAFAKKVAFAYTAQLITKKAAA
jgi:hypothetical protein